MLNFRWFENLVKNYKFAQKALNNDNVFLVWWVIRDILLWIQKEDFKDIDIAISWDPKDIFSKIDQNSWSIFKTDKFWTISIVDRLDNNCKYEITPFRSEWNYSDCRHPDEISRTSSLLEDSFRRDFTINCLYYVYINQNSSQNFSQEPEILDIDNVDKFLSKLKNNWFAFLKKNILIIQDKTIIKELIWDGVLNIELLKERIWDFWKIHIIIDPQDWLNDIIKQKIKAVWNPDDRINEDALRIIRWIRFATTLNCFDTVNFDFDWRTFLSLKKYYFLVNKLAKERLSQEIKKVFQIWNPFWFIALMDELNILKYIFPALADCKNFDQPTRYHPFDVYTHSILTLYHLQKINSNYLVRLWMLYHDIWKPDQYYRASIKKDEESQKELYRLEINHPIIWASLALEDFKKLWFSKKEIEEISFYVRYHMFIGELMFMNENKQKREIKKFISEHDIYRILNLCDITIWDRKWQYNPMQDPDLQWVFDLREKINKIYEEEWRMTLKDLSVDGRDIIDIVWESWPMIWEILNKLLEMVLEESLENKKEKLLDQAKEILKNKN